jgi:methionine aminotransferase
VILLDPCYDCYEPAVDLAGGVAVHIPLNPGDFGVDWQRVREAVTPKTRMILVNSPHNPSGAVFAQTDLDALADIVRDTGIFVLSDEVYEHIVFDGRPHLSLASSPLLASHTVVISSAGKTFHTTGWKIGYALAPARISAEIRKVHQFMTFSVNTPAQHALAAYLADPLPYLTLPGFYQAKRDLFCEGLASTPLRLLPCEGTYFVLADYSAVSDASEEDFAQRLVSEARVAAIPVGVFYELSDRPADARVVRFCFAKRDATLREGLARLTAFLGSAPR